MDWMKIGEFLFQAFGAVGGIFAFTSGFLLRVLIAEYRDRRVDSNKMIEVMTLNTSVVERVIGILDKRS